MTTLLEKAIERVGALPQAEQNAIAAEILASMADEAAWKQRSRNTRDQLRNLASEALEEDQRGETRPLDELL